MQYTFALLALVASTIASPAPQAITAVISPSAPAPSGCSTSPSGTYLINPVNVTSSSKRDLSKRVTSCGGTDTLVLTIQDGMMHDAKGRTGYIAANYQFQFDAPPQNGAIYTAGWSICGNETLALGGSAVFYQCLSGTFYNLYDESTGGQCSPIYIDTVPCEGGAGASSVTTVPLSTPLSSAASSAAGVATVTSVSTTAAPSTTATPSTTAAPSTTAVPTTVVPTPTTPPTTAAPVGGYNSTIAVSSGVQQSSDGQIVASTTTASATVSQFTGAANLLIAGKEFVAFAAGIAALAML
ncbi:Glycoside hydrolase 18 protein [Schaereria dolodes]|nr:Glycoside hydrolase 18 protein [Schaereria dolodes]